MAKKARVPWKRSNPRKRAGKKSKHLTPAQKSTAKARARRAGRPYPNLVDNMRMASKASKKKTAKKEDDELFRTFEAMKDYQILQAIRYLKGFTIYYDFIKTK